MKRARTQVDGGVAAIFFIVFVLPILFIGFILSVDLTRYFRNTQRAQQILDEAALQGYQYLPYQSQAKAAIVAYLASYPSIQQNTEIVTTEDSIGLSLKAESPMVFASYFVPGASITLTATSEVTGAPLDVYVALDTSQNLAPAKRNERPWGDEGSWPGASFFRNDYHVVDEIGPIDARNATQQCFNPAFSALKSAAIQVYEYMSGFKLNAVGVGFFPGEQLLDDVRPLSLSNQTLSDGGQAAFIPQRGGTLYNGLLCAAAAERETSHYAYRFPEISSRIPGLWKPERGAPLERVLPGSAWEFNPQYQPFLSAEDVLWSAMVQNEWPRSDLVISRLWTKLQGADFVSERGKTSAIVNQVAIVLTADVPWGYETITNPDGSVKFEPRRFPDPLVVSQLAPVFEQIRTFLKDPDNAAYNFNLLWVMLSHQDGPPDLTQRTQELQSYFDQWRMQDSQGLLANLHLTAITAQTPEDLVQKLTGVVALSGKTALLAK